MRRIVTMAALGAVLCASLRARSDEPPLLALRAAPTEEALSAAQTMKVNGIVLSVIGGLIAVIGVGLFAAAQVTDTTPGHHDEDVLIPTIAGLSLVGIGAVHLGIGVPLAAVGANREKKLERLRLRFGLTGLSGQF